MAQAKYKSVLLYYGFSNPLYGEDLKILKRHNVLLNIEIKIRSLDKGYPSALSQL